MRAASTSMPSMPSVPLISARPSLASSVSGASPASAARRPPAERRRRAAPRPRRSAPARTWASGARSPLAPSEPCSRTTGVMPALSSASDRLDDHRARARAAHRQRAGPQQHHRPHDLGLDRRPHAGGVRADERALQLLAALGGIDDVGQRAEAGRDAVDRLVGADELRHHGGARAPSPRGRRPSMPRARPHARRRPRRPARSPSRSARRRARQTPSGEHHIHACTYSGLVADATPTIYEWAGGREAFARWLNRFYDLVEGEESIARLFGGTVSAAHREHVTDVVVRGHGRPGALHRGARRLRAHARQAPRPGDHATSSACASSRC